MQAVHKHGPNRHRHRSIIEGLSRATVMSNIVSTNDKLQHALAVRVCNQKGRSCYSLASSILGSHQTRQSGEGGTGRGCMRVEDETGADQLRPGKKVDCLHFRKRGQDSGGLLSYDIISTFLSLSVAVTWLIRLPISIQDIGQVFARILDREACWLVPFFDQPVSWRIIPLNNNNELRATQAPGLKLGNAPNEFKGHLSN